MVKLNKLITFCITSIVLVSCASKPPLSLQLPLEKNQQPISLDFPELKSSLGRTVRWGGIIIETKNNKNNTQVTILGYPLDNQARPNTIIQNDSRRFIATFESFIEPNSYSKDREITIVGTLSQIEEGKIGEFDYEYPVVTVDNHVLWPKRTYYDDRYRSDYYYGYGYYGFYGYPYWGHYYGHHPHH